MKQCSVCSSVNTQHFLAYYDDRYGYPGTFQISTCNQCRHKYLEESFTPEQLTNLYTNYYPRTTFDINKYKPLHEIKGFLSWLNGEKRAYCWVPPNVRVLDIGCGFGETLGYHANRGCDVYGVEADENIRRVADKFGFKVHVGLFDPNIYEPAFFDYVTLDQVIEHVDDPIKTMEGISKVLKPNGLAILSTPNSNGWGAKLFGRKWIHWHIPYHLQHFSIESMKIAAERTGMKLEKVKTITSSEWLCYQIIHLFTRHKIGTPSMFWSPLIKRTIGDKIILSGIVGFHRITKINHLITRIFDTLGIGDCKLYFLRKQ